MTNPTIDFPAPRAVPNLPLGRQLRRARRCRELSPGRANGRPATVTRPRFGTYKGFLLSENEASRLPFWHGAGSPRGGRTERLLLLPDQCVELVLRQHGDAEFLRLVELAAGLFAGDDVTGFFRHTPRRLAAELFDEIFNLFAAVAGQRPGDHECFSREVGATA